METLVNWNINVMGHSFLALLLWLFGLGLGLFAGRFTLLGRHDWLNEKGQLRGEWKRRRMRVSMNNLSKEKRSGEGTFSASSR